MSEGQLGTGSTADSIGPVPVDSLHGLNIVAAAGGKAHSVVLLDDGSLLTWGLGLDGQLGHGSAASEQMPSRVDALRDVCVVAVACGGQHTVAVTDDGQVLTWGLGEFGQLGHGGTTSHYAPAHVLALARRRVVQVACGWAHTVALTNTGDVYVWGRGFEGQLGLGAETKCSLAPRYLAALAGQKIARVAAGVNFTAALTERGELYMWGDGSSGQLGQGGEKAERSKSHFDPVRVDALVHIPLQDVACGWGHTAALSKDGQMFVWGLGTHGQLGRGTAQPVYMPTAPLESLPGAPVVQIACGDHFTFALTASSDIYSWGLGSGGRLGHGDGASERLPRLLMPLYRLRTTRLACGWSHVLAVTDGAK